MRGKQNRIKAIPHNSKCRYGERGAADAKPKAQIILDAAKVSAASGGNSEPKQGQRSQSARGFCPRSTMRVPQPDIIEHFGNADAVPQLPERCLSRKAGIVRCCLKEYYEKQTPWPCFLRQPGRFCNHLQNKPRPGAKNARFYLWFQQKKLYNKTNKRTVPVHKLHGALRQLCTNFAVGPGFQSYLGGRAAPIL